MKFPVFPEGNHPVIQSLSHHSDQALLELFQQCRDQGQYFTAIFCRYAQLVYSLVRVARLPLQADYLFAKTWRHIYHELGELDLAVHAPAGEDLSLQSWILNTTAVAINQAELPPIETINYALSTAAPPLWCYLEQALDQLPAASRLMVILAQTFYWTETRIAAYLQAEGEDVSPAVVQAQLQAAYQLLETSLPPDIQEIYLRSSYKQTAGNLATGTLEIT